MIGWLKIAGIGIAVVAIVAGALAYRHELIEKGKNIVYAQDNAARVKAQDKQIADDAERVADLEERARKLSALGRQVKKEIERVPGPCIKDGADDPRLQQFDQWLRSRPPYNSRAPSD